MGRGGAPKDRSTKKGSVSDEVVCLTDFFFTFAAMLEQPVPAGAGEDSYDLRNVLLGRSYEVPLRQATVHHSVSGQFAIRKGKWKLIEGAGDGDFPRDSTGKKAVKTKKPVRDLKTGKLTKLDYFRLKHDGSFQLYNLDVDPEEKHNFADEHPEVVKGLHSLLNRYRTSGRSVSVRQVDGVND
jgi:arylsulfatase A-like enzyme